jgi:hypothetical protein
LISTMPDDCRGRFEPNTDGAALIDKGTLGGDARDVILGDRRHPSHHPETPALVISSLKRFSDRRGAALDLDPGESTFGGRRS